MRTKLRTIADHYGYEAQSRQLIEEMAELTQAINKLWRIDNTNCEKTNMAHIDAYKHIIEEITDVEICLEQVKWLLNIDESAVNEWKESKIHRSMKRMQKDK